MFVACIVYVEFAVADGTAESRVGRRDDGEVEGKVMKGRGDLGEGIATEDGVYLLKNLCAFWQAFGDVSDPAVGFGGRKVAGLRCDGPDGLREIGGGGG